MSSRDSELREIRGRALRLLSRRDYSSFQLRRKLLRHHPESLVEALLRELIEQRYVDDAGLAEERAVMLRRRRCWGPQRIQADLRRLGFDAKMVARATERAEAEFPSEQALARAMEAWTQKHGEPDSLASLRKLFDHCRRRGFPSQVVRDGLAPFWSRLGA